MYRSGKLLEQYSLTVKFGQKDMSSDAVYPYREYLNRQLPIALFLKLGVILDSKGKNGDRGTIHAWEHLKVLHAHR